jgi:hypothetical protein
MDASLAGTAEMPFKSLLRASADAWQSRHPLRASSDARAHEHRWLDLASADLEAWRPRLGRAALGATLNRCEPCGCFRLARSGSVAIVYPSATDLLAVGNSS